MEESDKANCDDAMDSAHFFDAEGSSMFENRTAPSLEDSSSANSPLGFEKESPAAAVESPIHTTPPTNESSFELDGLLSDEKSSPPLLNSSDWEEALNSLPQTSGIVSSHVPFDYTYKMLLWVSPEGSPSSGSPFTDSGGWQGSNE